mmetsp:Transcript_60147/g.144959  ORF Transcript_60147/g.144959 Transcript_60147/m.144959 type:complete len:209 (-) Transcript_60147:579-1205(-)
MARMPRSMISFGGMRRGFWSTVSTRMLTVWQRSMGRSISRLLVHSMARSLGRYPSPLGSVRISLLSSMRCSRVSMKDTVCGSSSSRLSRTSRVTSLLMPLTESGRSRSLLPRRWSVSTQCIREMRSGSDPSSLCWSESFVRWVMPKAHRSLRIFSGGSFQDPPGRGMPRKTTSGSSLRPKSSRFSSLPRKSHSEPLKEQAGAFMMMRS